MSYDWINCIKCKLSSNENCLQPIRPRGNTDAKLMLVDFAPTLAENRLNQIYAETEEILLGNMLASINLTFDDFYCTKIMKCYIAYGNVVGKDELMTCLHWLDAELDLVKPTVTLVLGADAGKALHCKGNNFAITKDRGATLYKGYTVYFTYHPRYLLRFPSLEPNSPKWEAWKDLIGFKKLIEEGGLPF